MGITLTNNAHTTLSADASSTDTTFYVDDIDSFPTLDADDYFYCTIERTSGAMEIVKVTQINSSSFIVERGQENTIPISFPIGSLVSLKMTVQNITDLITTGSNIHDDAYDSSWNGDTTDAPSRNAVYDKFELVTAALLASVSDTALSTAWDGTTTVAPSKNAVYDALNRVTAVLLPTGTDDTSALQALLTAGKTVRSVPGETYYISSRINITQAYSGVDFHPNSKVIMLSDTGEFDNTSSNVGDRYGTDAVGFYVNGVNNTLIRGLRIEYENAVDDRYVKAIAVRNSTGSRIENNDCSGFSKPYGVIYYGSCTDLLVQGNYVHDCTTNSATNGQITGIEADNDDSASTGVRIFENVIRRLTVGASFLASFGYQTDGINGVNASSEAMIWGNDIDTIGEGIDWFGDNTLIIDNNIDNAYYYGIKYVHGPSGNHVADNMLRRCGLAGILIAGSSAVTEDTADHYIVSNTIWDIDPNNTFSGSATAGITFTANGGTTYLPRRMVVESNFIYCGANGDYGVLAPSGSGTNNYVLRNKIRGATVADYLLDATVVPYFIKETLGNIETSGTLDLSGTTDATIARASAGDISVEGNIVYRAGGTDVPVTDGGTGASNASGARTNLGLGALAVLSTVGTSQIDDASVTLAKMADMATSSLIYRKTAGTGVPEVNTLATLKTDLGLTGTNSGDQTITLTGDVTGSGTSSFAATIANDAVTYAKMQNVSATNRIMGRITASAGDMEELTAANVKTILGLAQADITGLTTASSPQFTAIELGNASDTTLARVSAGVVSIEGVNILTTATGAQLAAANTFSLAQLITVTSAGAATTPLEIRNNSATANTEVIFEMRPASAAARTARIAAKNDGSNGISMIFRPSNGGSFTDAMILTANGLAAFVDNVTVHNSTAIPAGGTTGKGLLFSTTSNFGVFFGSGAPTLSAAKGSLYLRSDGSTTNDRMYVNTNGSTTWTAVTTVA